jgi:hypothetical protein
MATITAQLILDENNYTDGDITLTNLEYLIDNAINYVNLQTGLSISNLSGTAESKTVTVTSNESTVIKSLTVLMVRAYKDRGPNMGLSGLSVATLTSDPQYSLFIKIVDDGIKRLCGQNFDRV